MRFKVNDCFNWYELLYWLGLFRSIHPTIRRPLGKKSSDNRNYDYVNCSDNWNDFFTECIFNTGVNVHFWNGLCWYQSYLVSISYGFIARKMASTNRHDFKFMGCMHTNFLYSLLLEDREKLGLVCCYFRFDSWNLSHYCNLFLA